MVNRSCPPGSVVPWIVYEDVANAIDWLCDMFGFTERLRTPPDPDGSIHHAQLAVGQGAVVLTSRPGERPAPVTLLVKVPDVDSHHARVKQKGARIVNPPATHEFGERQYSVEDLAGNRFTFSQSVADMSPEQWGGVAGTIKSPVDLLPRPRLCYLEIPANDVHQSAAFYEKIFHWNIRHRDTDRPSFDDTATNVSGAWVHGRTPASEPGLLPYLWVDDIDETLDQVRANGGEIVKGPHPDSPGGETIALFRDPAGNLMGLYQESRRA